MEQMQRQMEALQVQMAMMTAQFSSDTHPSSSTLFLPPAPLSPTPHQPITTGEALRELKSLFNIDSDIAQRVTNNKQLTKPRINAKTKEHINTAQPPQRVPYETKKDNRRRRYYYFTAPSSPAKLRHGGPGKQRSQQDDAQEGSGPSYWTIALFVVVGAILLLCASPVLCSCCWCGTIRTTTWG